MIDTQPRSLLPRDAPMDHPSLPSAFLNRRVGAMAVGETGYLRPSQVAVDTRDRGWVPADSELQGSPAAGLIAVEPIEGGLRLDLTGATPGQWRRAGGSELIGPPQFVPVLEFKGVPA